MASIIIRTRETISGMIQRHIVAGVGCDARLALSVLRAFAGGTCSCAANLLAAMRPPMANRMKRVPVPAVVPVVTGSWPTTTTCGSGQRLNGRRYLGRLRQTIG